MPRSVGVESEYACGRLMLAILDVLLCSCKHLLRGYSGVHVEGDRRILEDFTKSEEAAT